LLSPRETGKTVGVHHPCCGRLAPGACDELTRVTSIGFDWPLHVWRANIIVGTADGCGTAEILRRQGKSKFVVAMAGAVLAECVDGFTRDRCEY
jgi:hypothetical protein